MKEIYRNFFIIFFIFISFMLLKSWQDDFHIRKNEIFNKKENNVYIKENDYLRNEDSLLKKNKVITVITDVFLLKINLYGGDIEEAFLLNFFDKLYSLNPFKLLTTSLKYTYQSQSGFFEKHNFNENYFIPMYTSDNDIYMLSNDKNELRIPLVYIDNNKKIIYEKILIFKRNTYAITVNYNIINNNDNNLELSVFNQLKQSINIPLSKTKKCNFILNSYRGSAYSAVDNKYKKYSFKNILSKDLNVFTNSGWVAMLQQYFVSAWIPITPENNIFYTKNINKEYAIIGFKSSSITIYPNDIGKIKSVFWIGPEIQEEMSSVSPYLNLTVDYGWLYFISQPLFRLLKFIYSYFHNWGVAIIIITLVVRMITYPLTKAQYISMAKIKLLQPKLEIIREIFKKDKYKQNQEIINLYKKEKVNPLGGCLPLFIQMPVFLGLYYVLSESIELRHSPFILWIHDLSYQDPYYVLPCIMGFSMFFVQKMSSSTVVMDPIQKKIMSYLPMFFAVFFLWMPSGLVLYYIISNFVTIFQQKFIYYSLNKNNRLKKIN